MAGRNQTFLRAWTLLAIFVLLSSLFAWSAIAAKPVLANSNPGDHLTFSVQPGSSYTADESIDVSVEVRDSGGVLVDEGDGHDAVITLSANGASLDAGDTTTVTADAGVATFSVHVRDVGTGYTLTASADGLTDGTSTAFDVTPGTGTHLAFVTQPANTSAGTTFTVSVERLDAYENRVTDDATDIDLDLSGPTPFDGTHPVMPTSGLATFSDLAVTTAGTGYTFIASDGVVPNVYSDSFDIAPGPTDADHTTIEAAPPTINTDIGTSVVTVTAKDQYDNLRGTGGDTVTVSTTHGTFSPTTPTSNGDGTYTTTLTDTLTGTDTVTGTINSSAIGDNATVDFTPGALSYFVFDFIGNQVAGAPFTVKVTPYDAHDNQKTNYAGGASLSGLSASPGCSGCSPVLNAASADYGTLTWDSNGVGTATGVTAFDADGAAQLTITDGSVSDVSGTFSVANKPALGGFDLAPIAGTKVAGTSFTANVTAYDPYGNVYGAYTDPAAHLTGLATSTGCTTCGNTLPAMAATYGGAFVWSAGSTSASVTAFKAEASTLTVTDGSISDSSTFTVDDAAILGAFDLAGIGGQTAGAGFSITATAYDPYGNVFDSFSGASTTLSGLGASPGCSICGNVLASVPATYGSLSWAGGVGTSMVTAYNAQATATLTVGNGTKSDSSSFTVDYKHSLGGLSIADIIGPKTAGTAFGVSVTAYDPYGNVKKDHTSVTLSGLTASPGCTAADCGGSGIAAASPTYVASTGWLNGIYGANVTAKKSQILASVTATDGGKTDTSTTFTVNAATATKLLYSDSAIGFNGRPIDTKLSQPIYSTCTPPGSGSNPCGVPPASTGTKVLAIDQFGNRATATVTIGKTAGAGTLANGTGRPTAGGTPGVAPFGEASFDTMNVNALGSVTLTATAPGTVSAATGIRIVDDLEACDGTLCDNLASNTLVKSFGKITTGSDFFNTGLQTNVLLDTALVPSTDFTNKCGSGASVFGNGSDVRIQGAGLGVTAPTTTMIIVVPKDTLKKFGITSRNAGSFNVCLGALWIDPLHSPVAWKTKGLGTSVVRDPGTDPLRYWGTPADCGTAGLPADAPCIALRTKQVSDVAAYMHMTSAQVGAFMRDSDVAIIVRKPFPWDGKGGLF